MGVAMEDYMVKKYALEIQMKFPPPFRSATRDGITVDVIVASVDVRRLMRESITMMAQNLGPFSNVAGLFSVVKAAVSCCAIVGARQGQQYM